MAQMRAAFTYSILIMPATDHSPLPLSYVNLPASASFAQQPINLLLLELTMASHQHLLTVTHLQELTKLPSCCLCHERQ